jgi:hypothetical protein
MPEPTEVPTQTRAEERYSGQSLGQSLLYVTVPVALGLLALAIAVIAGVQLTLPIPNHVQVNMIPYLLVIGGMFWITWRLLRRSTEHFHILGIFVHNLAFGVILAVGLALFDVAYYRVLDPGYELRANEELRQLYTIEARKLTDLELKADLLTTVKYYEAQIAELKRRPTPVWSIFLGIRLRLLLIESLFFSFIFSIVLRPTLGPRG